MKLTDLNPEFYGTGGDGITDSKTGKPVPYREGMGISFDCPCGADDCHRLYIPFANPIGGGEQDSRLPEWVRTGKTFEDLTLRPSLLRTGDTCKWHGYLTDGVLKSV